MTLHVGDDSSAVINDYTIQRLLFDGFGIVLVRKLRFVRRIRLSYLLILCILSGKKCMMLSETSSNLGLDNGYWFVVNMTDHTKKAAKLCSPGKVTYLMWRPFSLTADDMHRKPAWTNERQADKFNKTNTSSSFDPFSQQTTFPVLTKLTATFAQITKCFSLYDPVEKTCNGNILLLFFKFLHLNLCTN